MKIGSMIKKKQPPNAFFVVRTFASKDSIWISTASSTLPAFFAACIICRVEVFVAVYIAPDKNLAVLFNTHNPFMLVDIGD